MAFSDPQTITISGVTTSLPRVSNRANGSDYQSGDGLIKLSADNAYGRRTRRVLRVDHAKISPDLYVPSQNVRLSMSCYIVWDIPATGYTSAEALAIYQGLYGQANATSHALVTKLLGGES